MTDEQRYEFLRQSIESHDRQIGELVDNSARTDRQIAEMVARMEARDRETQAKFDALAQAMLGLTEHTQQHARRLERLES